MKLLFIGARLFEDVALYTKSQDITSIITESNPNAPNLKLADKTYIVKRGIEEPLDIAIKEDVDGVVPLIGVDGPLAELGDLKQILEEEHDINVITSPRCAAELAQDKIKTKKFLNKEKISTPKFDVIRDEIPKKYPAVLKQGYGQGGSGVKIALNKEEATDYMGKYAECLVEEFVEGIEISIEILAWKQKHMPLVPVYKGKTNLDGIHPLEKLKKAPLMIEGLNNTTHCKNIQTLAIQISQLMKVQGTIDMDLIYDGHEDLVIEINTRPSGTRYLTQATCGVNPLQELIDMGTGKWKPYRLKNIYNALEVPVGNYHSNKNNYLHREFQGDEGWIIHGPSPHQRITIRGKTSENVLEIARKLKINIKS